jgi:predicted aspartyl protease
MHTRGSVTYYVTGFINNAITSDFLVDTGSGYVTINTRTLEKLNDKSDAKFVKNISAVMADGSEKVVPVYQLSSIKFGESCVIKNIEAAVMPGTAANILGLSALTKAAPFSISMAPPTLTLTGCTMNNI